MTTLTLDCTIASIRAPLPRNLAPLSCTLGDVLELLATRGHERYTGEPVSHLEHALQCATLAQQAGAGAALTVAALLHDVGHLLHGLPGTPSALGLDDGHELLAEQTLLPLLGPEVSRPVGLHVLAKRYLAANPAYAKVLSDDSVRSLALQGGPLNLEACFQFRQMPHAMDAVRLRHWDEAAKQPGMPTPDLAYFCNLARTLSAASARH